MGLKGYSLSKEGFLFDAEDYKAFSPSKRKFVITSLLMGTFLDSVCILNEEAEHLMKNPGSLREPPPPATNRGIQETFPYRVDVVDQFQGPREDAYGTYGYFKSLNEAIAEARTITEESIKGFKSVEAWRGWGIASLVYDKNGHLIWDGIKEAENGKH